MAGRDLAPEVELHETATTGHRLSEEGIQGVIVVSFDFDGCFATWRFAEQFGKAGAISLADANQRFLADVQQQSRDLGAKLIFLVGSSRNDHETEKQNVDRGRPPLFPIFEQLSTDIEKATCNTLLLPDVIHGKAQGTTWGAPEDATLAQRFTIPGHVDKGFGTSIEIEADELKQALVYAQMHAIASQYPNADVTFKFVDDRADIIDAIEAFCRNNPHLIPKGMIVELAQYNTCELMHDTAEGFEKFKSQAKRHFKGTGSINSVEKNTRMTKALQYLFHQDQMVYGKTLAPQLPDKEVALVGAFIEHAGSHLLLVDEFCGPNRAKNIELCLAVWNSLVEFNDYISQVEESQDTELHAALLEAFKDVIHHLAEPASVTDLENMQVALTNLRDHDVVLERFGQRKGKQTTCCAAFCRPLTQLCTFSIFARGQKGRVNNRPPITLYDDISELFQPRGNTVEQTSDNNYVKLRPAHS
jgi:hypothetical protein